MTTPNIQLEQVPDNSLRPGAPVNDALQVIDALVRPGGIVQSRTVATPPTTTGTDVGKRWIIGASPTGAWSGKAGQIALCTAAGAWRFFAPAAGWAAYCLADASTVLFDGTAWAVASAATVADGSITGAKLSTAIRTATASDTAVLADANNVVQMDVATANTFTVPPNSAVAFPTGTMLEVWQIGTGQTTITAGAGVTIEVRAYWTLNLAGRYAGASLRKVGTDLWRLVGDLGAA